MPATECPDYMKKRADEFVAAADALVPIHPYVVVVLMHEVSRHSYPADPYIPFDNERHRIHEFEDVLVRCTEMARAWHGIGSYGANPWGERSSEEAQELKAKTGAVYGALWHEYPKNIVDEAKALIEERFSKNDIPLSLVEGASVIDIGCGSGRYSCALGMLGAGSVTGVDYSDSGLALAKQLALQNELDNVSFRKVNILDLPFEDETFDFVFCNGVTMLTGDIRKATEELYRVLKTGHSGWYYIYGAGGVFWYVRRQVNEFFKRASIPQDYALSVLRTIGMPGNRHIFADNWYVPIEEHVTKDQFEALLSDAGFSAARRCFNGRTTDPDYLSERGSDDDRRMWGDGELRYLVTR